MHRYLSLASSIFVACAFPYSIGAPTPGAIDVPLIRLIANPTPYEGKAIVVVGVLRAEFESIHLYVTREHYRKRLDEFAVGLSVRNISSHWSDLEKMNGRYVKIVGVYEAWSAPNGRVIEEEGPWGYLVIDMIFTI